MRDREGWREREGGEREGGERWRGGGGRERLRVSERGREGGREGGND